MKKSIEKPMPSFRDEQWDACLALMPLETLLLLLNILHSRRITVIALYQYYLRVECHKLFEQGNTAYDAMCLLNMPKATAYKYKKLYDAEFPVE